MIRLYKRLGMIYRELYTVCCDNNDNNNSVVISYDADGMLWSGSLH